LKLNTHFP